MQRSEPTTAAPNPGSNDAISRGCTCPVLDNAHGKGYYGREGVFIYTCGCPVHWHGDIIPSLESTDAG